MSLNILAFGSNGFSNYSVFMRMIAVAMSSSTEDEINVYSVGPRKVNRFAAEFCNVSENGMKARGKKLSHYKRPYSWAKDNLDNMDYVAYLTVKGDKAVPSLILKADDLGIENSIFRF